MNPGEYYPRMTRNIPVPEQPGLRYGYHVVLQALLRRLEGVFAVVHPADLNKTVYGDELRHLLIIACTEVEGQWVGIMQANGYNPPSGKYTTKDYVKLCSAMRLNDYAFRLWLHGADYTASIQPFRSWSPSAPTQSIVWYDAYNAVKHDRATNFHKATLENVIDAIGAFYILGRAQFGSSGMRGRGIEDFDQMQFGIPTCPQWTGADAYSDSLQHSLRYPF